MIKMFRILTQYHKQYRSNAVNEKYVDILNVQTFLKGYARR